MKALIIGGAGFVGTHLAEYLYSLETVETYVTKLPDEIIDAKCVKRENIYDLDILEAKQVISVIHNISPDYIFHLAAQSSVAFSWKNPSLTYNINIIGTVNILEAVRTLGLKTRILMIGSAEEYGNVTQDMLPIDEEMQLRPSNPYAVSKFMQEINAVMYVETFNLDIIMVRAFNHIGPGQAPTFVMSDFAKQIVEIENGLRSPVINVGNLAAKRDFSDVRDIVRGYWALMQKGRSGEVYNIGSGKSYALSDLLNKMISLSKSSIEVNIDSNKFRPTDIKELRADIGKIISHTSWQPAIRIEDSLADILDYWREKC